MKKAILILLIVRSFVAFSCDNCNVYLNISPNDYRNSFGVYHHSRFMYGKYNELGQVLLKHGGVETSQLLNKEVIDIYRTYELRGTFYLKDRWKTMFTLPIVDNTEKIDGLAKYRIKGLGDPMLIQTYQLYNTKQSSDTVQRATHRFTMGGGVKIPLGSISNSYDFGTPNLDLQPGSGSWDFLFLTTYAFRYKSLGFSTNLNVKFNTYNQENFRYGNTLNMNANIFYIKELKGIVFMPFVGTYIEQFEKDYEYSIINDSGGATFFGNIGLKLYKDNWSLNAQYQRVYDTQLNGDTQLFTIYRTSVGLNYNF